MNAQHQNTRGKSQQLGFFQRAKKAKQLLTMFAALGFAKSAFAQGDFDIGEAPDGPLQEIVDFIQDVVNLLAGPGMYAVGFVSLVMVVFLWVFAPKLGGILALAARVAIGVIIAMNLPLWYVYLGGDGG